MGTPRMTLTTQAVVKLLLANDNRETYGGEVTRATGLEHGTVYPILERLAAVRWLRSRWEDIDPATEGRPPRHYYAFTDHGRVAAAAALSRAEAAAARRRTGS